MSSILLNVEVKLSNFHNVDELYQIFNYLLMLKKNIFLLVLLNFYKIMYDAP